MRFAVLTVVSPALAAVLGCAAPVTQFGTVSPDDVRAEQVEQRRLALELQLQQQARVEDVAFGLLQAAVPYCGNDVGLRFGARIANADVHRGEYYDAALALGFSDTLVVAHVARGSGAEQAGIRSGDRVLRVGGQDSRLGDGAVADFRRRIEHLERAGASTVTLTYRRGPEEATANVPLDFRCTYVPLTQRSDVLNAYADGRAVVVTSAMLRFADDDGLAVVLAHEIAHNAMRHIDAKMTNALFGALLGAIADIAAATQGVNTGGDFSSAGAKLGAITFSQDFEREADYVGHYILALAGRPLSAARAFWRHMAVEKPEGISFASSHPTTAERFVRLEQVRSEIEQKLARGEVLSPQLRNATPSTARAPAVAPSRRTISSAGALPAPNASATPDAPRLPSRPATVSTDQPLASRENAARRPPTAPSDTGDARSDGEGGVDRRAARYSVDSTRGDMVTYTFGPPVPTDGMDLVEVRRRAREAFEIGEQQRRAHRWVVAEAWFRLAARLDGSVAAYHAGLGSILMVLERWAEAEAALSAAVLLDVRREEYRRKLLEARAHR